eukprot:gene5491-6838_t
MSKVFKKHPGKQIQGPGMFSTLPLLGNLHLLGGQLHLGFHKLALQYQHIFKFWMGDHYTVVVSDPKLLREIWVKNNDNFINRIRTPSIKMFSSNYRSLAFGDKEYWLNNRAMVGQTFTKLKILNIAKKSLKTKPNSLLKLWKNWHLLVNLYVGTPRDQIKTFIKEIHEDHLKSLDPQNPRDLLDSFIIGCKENGLDPELPINIGIDFLMGGTDTSSATIEWFTFSSKPFLSLKSKREAIYSNAVIKEVMRIHPIGPLGIPRVAHNDIFIDEYFIPKGTQMIQNNYTLSHSSDFWENPQDFIPERFLDDKHSDVFIPFSVGPRNCIAQSLAQEEIFAICTNFILNFQVSPLDGVDQIEEDAIFGLTLVPKPYGLKLKSRN